MSLYAYNSLNNALHRDLGRFFNSSLFGSQYSDSRVEKASWTPVVDIKETDESFVLLAEIPGVDPKGVELVTEKNELVIRGEKKLVDEENERWIRRELKGGEFERKFILPENVDSSVITAKINHGILEVVIPKVKEQEVQRVSIEF